MHPGSKSIKGVSAALVGIHLRWLSVQGDAGWLQRVQPLQETPVGPRRSVGHGQVTGAMIRSMQRQGEMDEMHIETKGWLGWGHGSRIAIVQGRSL